MLKYEKKKGGFDRGSHRSPYSFFHLNLLSPALKCPLYLSYLFVLLSSPVCLGHLLPAPGRDERLQLGVHAALQLDSGHRGPQPQHCIEPHSLWVRTAVLSQPSCQDIFTSMHTHIQLNVSTRKLHVHPQNYCRNHFICLLHTAAVLSFVLPLRVNIQQTPQH